MPRQASKGARKRANAKKVVLIVGDSFIDENWLMSRSEIYHSYNVGKEHYISSLPSADSRIISFCGAGGVWRIFRGRTQTTASGRAKGSLPPPMPGKHDILALSGWNPADGMLLMCLLCDQCDISKGLTPYRMSGLRAPRNLARALCPFASTKIRCRHRQWMFNLIGDSHEDAETGTSSNHLVRLYEGFGSDQIDLRFRLDWRLNLEKKYKDYTVVSKLKRRLQTREVEAIVIVDHGYGVIDDQLIRRLNTTFDGAKWYIRSKLETPDWMAVLGPTGDRLRLVFTDEQLLEHKYGVRTWRHGTSLLGRGALEVLGDLLGLPKYVHAEAAAPTQTRAQNAALLFEDDTVVAASRTEGADLARLINIGKAPGEKKAIRVGRSTVFFSSLVYWDLMHRGLDESMQDACSWALNNAYDWTKECTRVWLEDKPSNLTGPFDTAIYTRPLPKPVSAAEPASSDLLYQKSWDAWNQSSMELGIVGKPGEEEKQIHLWRAHGTLKDYICPGGKKRSEVNDLISRLKIYQGSSKPKYPFNCLLLAEPGWGKSTLAQCLADHFGVEHLGFSIAQMASNDDLINSLKEIVSTQNRTQRRVLVFIDEIDAQIESHTGMGLLLGPIWGGSFMSEGNIYRIEPCMWVFASTKPLSRLRQETKGRDFLSRINGPIINLDFFANGREDLDKETDEKKRQLLMADIVQKDPESKYLRTEMVYHGVNFLNRIFGPISAIDENVLRIFYNTMPIDGIRSLEIFASRFRDISGGRVRIRNVPDRNAYPELQRHIAEIGGWPSEDSDRLVRVVVNPPK